MKSDLTEIAFVLDRSGSMQSIAPIAIRGFNDFLTAHQTAPGQARLTLVLFDDEYLVSAASLPVAEVVPLDETTFVPRGCTALLDAIGRTIDELGERLSRMSEAERPGAVIVAILTDGLENASSDYKLKDVASRIRHQRETYKWEFLFLGANQDAIATAARMNIGRKSSATYIPGNVDSASHAITRVSTAVRHMRSGTATREHIQDLSTPMQQIADDEAKKKKTSPDSK